MNFDASEDWEELFFNVKVREHYCKLRLIHLYVSETGHGVAVVLGEPH